jgi:hypothetical protein
MVPRPGGVASAMPSTCCTSMLYDSVSGQNKVVLRLVKGSASGVPLSAKAQPGQGLQATAVSQPAGKSNCPVPD